MSDIVTVEYETLEVGIEERELEPGEEFEIARDSPLWVRVTYPEQETDDD